MNIKIHSLINNISNLPYNTDIMIDVSELNKKNKIEVHQILFDLGYYWNNGEKIILERNFFAFFITKNIWKSMLYLDDNDNYNLYGKEYHNKKKSYFKIIEDNEINEIFDNIIKLL